MEDIILKYVQSCYPDKLVGNIKWKIINNILIITYFCRISFEPLPNDSIEGIPEDGIKQVAFEKWIVQSKTPTRDEFFTWCIDNIDDYDIIIDLNTEWDSIAEII